MSATTLITIFGISMLILYIIIQILNFYGVGQDVYGIYLVFFLFLMITSLILPTSNPKI